MSEVNAKIRPAADTTTSVAGHEPRNSDRVRLRVRVQISGIDADGQKFSEGANTQTLSRSGASLILRRTVSAGTKVTVQFGHKEARMRIVGQVGIVEEGHVYGAAFVESQPRFWNIHFPRLTKVDEAVGRLLLRCPICARQEIVHLNEVEVLVYEANRAITRRCDLCRNNTLWQLVEGSEEEAHVPVGLAPVATAVPDQTGDHSSATGLTDTIVIPPLFRGGGARKHRRLLIRKAKACIRRHSFPDDIVNVVDLSRGGLRFHSPNEYHVGAWVQVAVPYLSEAGNIFVSGRIIRVQVIGTEDSPGEYAIQYSGQA